MPRLEIVPMFRLEIGTRLPPCSDEAKVWHGSFGAIALGPVSLADHQVSTTHTVYLSGRLSPHWRFAASLSSGDEIHSMLSGMLVPSRYVSPECHEHPYGAVLTTPILRSYNISSRQHAPCGSRRK